jgi:arsenite oxidase small subunit
VKSDKETRRQGDKGTASPFPPVPLSPSAPIDERRRRLIQWLWRIPVLAAVGGAAYAAYEVYFHLNRLEPNPNPSFNLSDPEKVAEMNQFEQPWDSLEFSYQSSPAILVQLPQAISGGLSVQDKHLAAFSRFCTHQGCIVTLNKNLESIAVAFNYRTDEPTLTCQCHFSAFSLTQAGQAVSGPAVKPLPRIRLELRETSLYATGIEQTG